MFHCNTLINENCDTTDDKSEIKKIQDLSAPNKSNKNIIEKVFVFEN